MESSREISRVELSQRIECSALSKTLERQKMKIKKVWGDDYNKEGKHLRQVASSFFPTQLSCFKFLTLLALMSPFGTLPTFGFPHFCTLLIFACHFHRCSPAVQLLTPWNSVAHTITTPNPSHPHFPRPHSGVENVDKDGLHKETKAQQSTQRKWAVVWNGTVDRKHK